MNEKEEMVAVFSKCKECGEFKPRYHMWMTMREGIDWTCHDCREGRDNETERVRHNE